MNQIKVLPQNLVDKIAAGEVIERPASVVKELLENSLDAGATEIRLEIEEGGRRLIRIMDNGRGIQPADLKLLFIRHATSKIVREADLTDIKSLGFRGEALASIAAVSEVKIISQTAGETSGWVITARDEFRGTPAPAAAPGQGTTAEIRNLFFNTPARLKFLKSVSVEFGHITDAVTRYALSWPNVRFDLLHNGKPVLNLPALNRSGTGPGTDNLLDRIKYLLGEDITPTLIRLADGADGWSVTGFISTPGYTKSTMRSQWLYLNQRYIRDRLISRAIVQAYSDFIPAQRFPVVIMFLKLPPAEFDVNVHPTKTEVRFRNTWGIHNLVTSLVRKALTAAVPVPESPRPETPAEPLPPVTSNQTLQAMVDFFTRHRETNPAAVGTIPPTVGINTRPFTAPVVTTIPEPTRPLSPRLSLSAVAQAGRNYLQVHNAYIIEEVPDGLIIIDQHALHERLIYDRLTSAQANVATASQQLLVPETLTLEIRQMALLTEARPALKELGFDLQEFGPNTVLIRALPQFISGPKASEVVSEILQMLAEEGETDSAGPAELLLKDRLRKVVACKAAVKAGERLSEEQMAALLAQYHERSKGLPGDLTCPHGRPAVYRLTRTQIDRWFLR